MRVFGKRLPELAASFFMADPELIINLNFSFLCNKSNCIAWAPGLNLQV